MPDYRGHQPIDRRHILNARTARDLPDRPPIPCRARLEWEHDGEQWIDTTATRWDRRTGAVFVLVLDGRCFYTGVWLGAEDVELEHLG